MEFIESLSLGHLALLLLIAMTAVIYVGEVMLLATISRFPIRDAATYPVRRLVRWLYWRRMQLGLRIQSKLRRWLGITDLQTVTQRDAIRFTTWLARLESEFGEYAEGHAKRHAMDDTDFSMFLEQYQRLAAAFGDMSARLTFYEHHSGALNYSYEKLMRMRKEYEAKHAKTITTNPEEANDGAIVGTIAG